MHLEKQSVEWALDFIARSSDSDLFPPNPEFNGIQKTKDAFVDALTTTEVHAFSTGESRRFIVPKDDRSYRAATQLDPQDALILTALVHQLGAGIEQRRLGRDQVFSYRFDPSPSGLYTQDSGWNDFWSKASAVAGRSSHIVYCDIADFYNQVYHHTLENQLTVSGFPNQATKWIMGLIESTTAGVSRGVPVGPHGIHLLAEATLVPIDNALLTHGLSFLRYADDIVVFVNDEREVRHALTTIVTTLDKQQRLQLQRHKTRVFTTVDFIHKASQMILDQPISTAEDDLLALVSKYSRGNPYRTVWFSEISEEDWSSITESTLSGIVADYLSRVDVDYTRLGWLYRRLAQIGHPGALHVTLANLDVLTPCFPSVMSYLASIQKIESSDWLTVGAQLADLLSTPGFEDQEYFQVMILSLFARNRDMNHFVAVAKRFTKSSPAARRQILLAARTNGAVDWLRELKEDFHSMDGAQKLAFLFAMGAFPPDERKYFINRQLPALTRPIEQAVAKAARLG